MLNSPNQADRTACVRDQLMPSAVLAAAEPLDSALVDQVVTLAQSHSTRDAATSTVTLFQGAEPVGSVTTAINMDLCRRGTPNDAASRRDV